MHGQQAEARAHRAGVGRRRAANDRRYERAQRIRRDRKPCCMGCQRIPRKVADSAQQLFVDNWHLAAEQGDHSARYLGQSRQQRVAVHDRSIGDEPAALPLDRRRLLRAERVHSGPIEERADGIDGRISVERVDQRSSLVEHVFVGSGCK